MSLIEFLQIILLMSMIAFFITGAVSMHTSTVEDVKRTEIDRYYKESLLRSKNSN